MKNRLWSQSGRGSATGILYDYLLGQVHMYCERIVAACGELHRVHSAFRAGRDARHAHCDFAITSLSQFKVPVLGLYALFRDFLEFPDNSDHYYPLLLSLCEASEQGQRLQSLISSYRHVCQTYSRQLVYQKLEIYDALEQLIGCSKEALTRIDHFMNEARFSNLKSHCSHNESLPVSNHCRDDECASSKTDSSRDNVIVLQQYWPHPLYRSTHQPPQVRTFLICLYEVAPNDGV